MQILAPDKVKEAELFELIMISPDNCDIELKKQNGKTVFATLTIKIKVEA